MYGPSPVSRLLAEAAQDGCIYFAGGPPPGVTQSVVPGRSGRSWRAGVGPWESSVKCWSGAFCMFLRTNSFGNDYAN